MNPKRELLHHLHAGRCLWCNCQTKLVRPKCFHSLKANASTIDHLINKLDRPDPMQDVIVNACNRCNERRGREATRTQTVEQQKARVALDKALYQAWLARNDVRMGAVDTDREKQQRATA